MGRKNNGEVEKQRTSHYVDIKDLYVKFLKKSFIKLEDFLKLTIFEVNCSIKAYYENYDDMLILAESLANVIGMTGFSRLKEPIRWRKQEKRINIDKDTIQEALEDLEEINRYYS